MTNRGRANEKRAREILKGDMSECTKIEGRCVSCSRWDTFIPQLITYPAYLLNAVLTHTHTHTRTHMHPHIHAHAQHIAIIPYSRLHCNSGDYVTLDIWDLRPHILLDQPSGSTIVSPMWVKQPARWGPRVGWNTRPHQRTPAAKTPCLPL